MNSILVGSIVFAGTFGASLLALAVRRLLPEHHLKSDTKDTVQLAMGLVATMTALVLGLLVASSKGSYDDQRNEVITMASKIAFLDRSLTLYGPDAAAARDAFHRSVEVMVARQWSESPTEPARMDAQSAVTEQAYHAFHALAPKSDAQGAIKAHALDAAKDLGLSNWLLCERSGSSVSPALLVIVSCWLAILFFSFGLFAPRNATAVTALLVAALSAAGAIFLILELDRPFNGLLQIPREPMINALHHTAK